MKSPLEIVYTHYSYATQQVMFSTKKLENNNLWNQGYWALSPGSFQYSHIYNTLVKLEKKNEHDIMMTIRGVPSYK